MPSFVRVELRVERGFLFRLSGRELLKKVGATARPGRPDAISVG